MGGISRTVAYKGNRIDIGGHRFFSKSDRVMDWWTSMLPVEQTSEANHRLVYQSQERAFAAQAGLNGPAPDPEFDDLVMLVRPRKSRIFYLRKLFDYPLKLDLDHAAKSGRAARPSRRASAIWPAPCGLSVPRRRSRIFSSIVSAGICIELSSRATPKKCGACLAIRSARNGARSASRAFLCARLWLHHFKKLIGGAFQRNRPKGHRDLADRKVPLPEARPRPTVGRSGQPGACRRRRDSHRAGRCAAFTPAGDRVTGVTARSDAGEQRFFPGAVCVLHHAGQGTDAGVRCAAAREVSEVSDGLMYRDFITVGLLLKPAEDPTERRGTAAEGQLDLHSGARCAGGPHADLQQLEPVHGGRPGQGLDRPGVLLQRHR